MIGCVLCVQFEKTDKKPAVIGWTAAAVGAFFLAEWLIHLPLLDFVRPLLPQALLTCSADSTCTGGLWPPMYWASISPYQNCKKLTLMVLAHDVS